MQPTHRSSRIRVVLLVTAALLTVGGEVASAHTLSSTRAKAAAEKYLAGAQGRTAGATSHKLGSCRRSSSHRYNCAGSKINSPTQSCTLTVVARYRTSSTRRVSTSETGRKCQAVGGGGGNTGGPFFSGAFGAKCDNVLVPPCRRVALDGKYDAEPRGRQLDRLKVVVLQNGGVKLAIQSFECPTQLPEKAPVGTTNYPNDTFECFRTGQFPTVGSDAPLKFIVQVDEQQAAAGTTFQLYGRPQGGAYEGPLTTVLR